MSSSSSRKKSSQTKTETGTQLLQLLSSVGPPQQVVLKKQVVETAHPPFGDPKPLGREPPYRDRNLKGQDANILSISPENSKQQSETTRKPNNNQTKPKHVIRENMVVEYGVAGTMGRPDVLRCRGGDRDTEGAIGSSRPGNRPPHTLARQEADTIIEPQNSMVQRFAGSFSFTTKTQTRTRQDGLTVLQLSYIQMQRMPPHNAQTRTLIESRCPGETTRRWLGRPSPNAKSRKSPAISGVRDGHRNRKSQKSLRLRCAREFENIHGIASTLSRKSVSQRVAVVETFRARS